MIKIETEKDGKINAAICGAPDAVKEATERITEAAKKMEAENE